MVSICLVPLIPIDVDLVRALVTPLSQIFQTNVFVKKSLGGIVDRAYDFSRAQYNSTSIIRELLYYDAQSNGNTKESHTLFSDANDSLIQNGTSKILGITSVDLFVPILTYVFGEAQLEGTAGIMSTYRLDDTIYGLPTDNVKLFERSIKEAVHELGHTFGLLHCKNYNCAMHASTTVDDVDVKGATLCIECLNRVVNDKNV